MCHAQHAVPVEHDEQSPTLGELHARVALVEFLQVDADIVERDVGQALTSFSHVFDIIAVKGKELLHPFQALPL